MRIIKFLIIILVLVFLGLVGGWYFITLKVASELNNKYSGQEIEINAIDGYFVHFDKASPAGFPYKVAWDIQGWCEENNTSNIEYKEPIQFGYDLLSQQLFISYDGEIIASYKPVKHGFGSLLKINDYKVTVDLPLTTELFGLLKDFQDPIQLINYIKKIKISTDKVEIFDLVDNEKFYDKEYEVMKIGFTPRKQYDNLDDLLNNIPNQYYLSYTVKTKPNNAKMRRLPISLFYGFSAMPSGFDMKAEADISTDGLTIKEFLKGLEVKSKIAFKSTYVDLPQFNLYYKSGNYSDGRNYSIDTDAKIKTHEGLFDAIFANYDSYAKSYLNSPSSKIIDREIRYIISNKEAFKFAQLEDSNYDLILKMNTENRQNKTYVKLDDFSILSEQSGIRLKHNMETTNNSKKDWLANGVLYVNNYPSVIEFTSGYIYRFGKFRFLNDQARELYVEVNKAFFKDISDYPKSESNDLSFEYSIDSNRLMQTKFGSTRFDQIPQLYSLMIYQKLFDKVGHGGDVLGRIKQILPNIDTNEPMLKKILPRISGDKSVDKSIQEKINKVVPKEAQDIIKQIIPKDKMGKSLLKNFIK